MNKIILIFLICIIFFINNNPANALQRIILVPSADILKPKKTALKFTSRFRPFGPGPYDLLSPSATIGIRGNQEAGFAIASIDTVHKTQPSYDLFYKKGFNITNNTKFTTGISYNINAVNTILPNVYAFAHLSKQIVKTNTRLTSGVYFLNNKDHFPNRTGAVLGLEQTIVPQKFQIAVDWNSRNENIGFIGAGIKVRPVPSISITSGALIPNGSNSRFSFVVSITKFTK